MKQIILALSLIILITPQSSFAMNCNEEEGIPLEPIYRSKQNSKKNLEEQLTDFNKKINAEFHKKDLKSIQYITRLNQELPAMLADDETIEKFAQNKDSFFGKSIQNLIMYAEVYHYKKVTGDTLATINNPSVKQPSTEINNLPLTLKKYVMKKAYDQIDEPYSYLELSNKTRYFDLHSKVNLAATANDVDGTFQLWNLKTRTADTLPKKSIQGGIKFSNKGYQLATVTVSQANPQIIDVDVWDIHTKDLIHTIPVTTILKHVSLENESTTFSTLILLDRASNLSLYKIEKNRPPILLYVIESSISSIDPINSWGNYAFSRSNNTLVITKKCTAYFLCQHAIKNSVETEALQNIYTTLLYGLLDNYEKNLISISITKKMLVLANQPTIKENQKKEIPKNFLASWFG